ncbi:adenylate/guanylate cyclase domain-containing protein [Acuticoccus sediminis]|uniref:adenylate/guanylate cyclase domain-containing protein n=1 Tax=Acuticoccus sediminis TaxID=2184697 RepID=UPI001CFD7B8B|nr:hypothetical protein [Acuticoccus sediminis]
MNDTVILVVDVVESVRLMQKREGQTVRRWLELTADMGALLEERQCGQILKKSGDGVIFRFDSVPRAVEVGLAILSRSAAANRGVEPGTEIMLRMALEVCPIIVAPDDIYGHGLNVAMRMVTLAGPGEIVATARAREQLVAGLDATVEDLGDCYLKHIEEPVRVFKISGPAAGIAIRPLIDADDLAPMLAVIPFEGLAEGEGALLGEVLAEELITNLGRSSDLRVVSRLSTTALRGRALGVADISRLLHADYVLSGTYRVVADELVLDVELAEPDTASVFWSERRTGSLRSVLDPSSEFVAGLVDVVSHAIVGRELRLARSRSVSNLKHYTLMIAAVALMNRLSPRDFAESRRLLEALIERATRQAVPQAWLAKWHILRVQQGWSDDPERDGALAAQATRIALEVDPECSLALAIDGFVKTNLIKRFDLAETRFDEAIDVCPSNSLAWILRANMHVFRGEGEAAVSDARRALSLSPLDPHRFFYDALSAGAYFANAQYERAIEYARASMRLNRQHTSTLRILAVSLLRLGADKEAGRVADLLREVEPNLTVENWLRRSPSADYPIGRDFARSLAELGFPQR